MRRRYYQDNPLKAKALTNRLDELAQLGIPSDVRTNLEIDLAEANVEPSNAIYVLDWWRARLALLRFLELPEGVEKKTQDRLVGILQSYATKYKLTAFDLALDAELQIDYWEELRHFIQMSGVNPYFKEPWPFLHKVVVDLPEGWYDTAPVEREIWIGKLVKDNIKLSTSRPRYNEGIPAIKLLRGKYWADPPGDDNEKELPKDAIVVIEGTHKPSDLLEFLREAESSLQESRFFIPKSHDVFMSFPDGKAWVIVDDEDRDAEKRSLGDCATGEYSDTAMVIISLREPVMSSSKGTYYKTILRAELVFPQQVPRSPSYDQFKHSVGVINQLRGYANSKPKPRDHRYIVPLLAQDWVGQLVRPAHRPDDVFWVTDLNDEHLRYLQAVNPRIFDPKGFYEQLKNLSFPTRLEEKIVEGIEFPTAFVVQMLSEISPREFGYRADSPRGKIITKTLSRRLQQGLPDPQLQELLDATETAILRMRAPDIAEQLFKVGFTLSTAKIQEVLSEPSHTLDNLAAQSLGKKLEKQDETIAEVLSLAREVLLTPATSHSGRSWPVHDNRHAYLLAAGVYLTVDQVLAILTEIDLKEIKARHAYYFWNLALDSIEKLNKAKTDLKEIPALLERLCLDPETPYKRVGEILNLGVVELSETQISQILAEKPLLPGRTLTALDSLEIKVRSNTLVKPKRTLAIAHDAMLRLQERSLVEKALPWVNIPTRSLVRVLMAPRINREVRITAIDAIKQKINTGDARIRGVVYHAVKTLLLRTREKNLIRRLLRLYEGHQHQYKLFYALITEQLEWLTEDNNRKFFLSLIADNLPKTKSGYYYENTIPKPVYRIIQRLVRDDLIEDNCTFVLKLLFETRFDATSKKMVRALLEIVLDAIIKSPKKLTRELCDWFRNKPAGWGSTERRVFTNLIPLSPKLLRQFKALVHLSSETANSCYVDLAVTIAQAMSSEDKKKLYGLAKPLLEMTLRGDRDYLEYLNRLLSRRRMRRKS